jgi:hypothetical protein
LGLRLASIAIAARNLADDLDRGLDLASDQKRTNYLPVYAHQELAKHGADDELLCGFMIEYVDSFKNPARLNLDGDLNKNSPALCLFKEIIRLAVKRIPLCSKVEIPAAIKMINGIVDLRVGQMGQEPKEDSSIAARLKKAN